ncbi:MAG: serine/threonine protein kinase [Planctomycetes bacterium]|nr:serine/threonine protein kinase [Planctomycetota bacterium]
MSSGDGEAWRRAEEAVLRHCVARGLLGPGRIGELRAEAAAAAASVLALVARSVPATALDELRRVHRDALASDPSAPPLLRGQSLADAAEAPWQDADTFVHRSSGRRGGTERLSGEDLRGRSAEEHPTVREATTIPLPGAPPDAQEAEERDTVRDLPAVDGPGDTTIRLADGAPLPLPPPAGPAVAGLVDRGGGPGGAPRGPAAAFLASTRADVSRSDARPPPPPAGDDMPVLIGPFPVQAEVGRGRTGVVYRAWHAELGREVAIKVPPPRCGPAAAAAFLTAARAMARLRHPSIVTVHEVGEAEGRPYLVTDIVGERTLAAVIHDDAPLHPRDAVQVARSIALGLAEAHRRAVLHGALRPRNVLMAGRLEPVLTDFGMTADPAADDVSYVSPEEAAGREVDGRADLHALGALLYALLTGEPPRAGADDGPGSAAPRHGEVWAPSRRVEGIGPDLDAVCLRCLAPDPVDRYASAQDLADDLQRLLDGVPVRRPPLLRRLSRRIGAQPGLAALTLGLLAGLAGLAAWLVVGR